jgi:hypothetical protein
MPVKVAQKLTGRYTPLSLTTDKCKSHVSYTMSTESCDALPLHGLERKVAGKATAVIRSLTAHFILAGILTSGAADAQNRRCLGAHDVDSLKSWVIVLSVGVDTVIGRDDSAGSAGEGVSDRHGGEVSAEINKFRGGLKQEAARHNSIRFDNSDAKNAKTAKTVGKNVCFVE